MLRVSRRTLCSAACFAGITLAVVALPGCSGLAAPHAFVSPAQQAAISRFYVRKLWIDDGESRIGCPVDVLGAQHIRGRLRVYTVIVCHSFTAKCALFTAYTEGLVADMAGTRVIDVLRDDAPDEAGDTAEASIYPESIRSAALGYINNAGPNSLYNRAAQMAGCPHWTQS
jgi:hypothetical protein